MNVTEEIESNVVVEASSIPGDAPGDSFGEPKNGGEAQQGMQLAPTSAGTLQPGLPSSSADRQASQQPAAPAGGDVELLSRFLVGVVTWGGDQLFQRLRVIQEDLDTHPELFDSESSLEEESTTALARYLAIGLAMRGQKRAVKGVRSGLGFSLGVAGWALDTANTLTDNRLTRPIRRPVESRLRNLAIQASVIAREGKLHEQKGRLLATDTIGDITDDVIPVIVDNPTLNEAIPDLIGRQSVGLAGIVTDNIRSVTVVADSVTESLVRKILRRTPRTSLPPSAFAGKPQTMYDPSDKLEGLEDYLEELEDDE